MSNTLTTRFLAFMVATLGAFGGAHASLVHIADRWGGPLSPPTLDQDGTLIVAANLGGQNLTFQGIDFLGVRTSSTSNFETFAGSPELLISSCYGQANAGPFSGSPSAGLFETEIFSYGSPCPFFLGVRGLDPLKTYRLQFLHGDTRNFGSVSRYAQSYYDDQFNFLDLPVVFGAGGLGQEYLDQIIEVTGTSGVTARMPGADNRGPSYSGLLISEMPATGTVPVPGTFALFGLGLFALVCSRQHKSNPNFTSTVQGLKRLSADVKVLARG